MQAIQECCHT